MTTISPSNPFNCDCTCNDNDGRFTKVGYELIIQSFQELTLKIDQQKRIIHNLSYDRWT